MCDSCKKSKAQQANLGSMNYLYNLIHLYEKKGFANIIFEGEDDMGKFVKILKVL